MPMQFVLREDNTGHCGSPARNQKQYRAANSESPGFEGHI